MSWSAARPTSSTLDRLDSGMKYRLVLIIAPQGAGKTRLLREWMGERSKNSSSTPAWITLNQQDNKLETFLLHLIVQIGAIEPTLESRLKPVKREWETFTPEGVLIDLINLLAEHPQEIALILDEYHQIESPEVHQAISIFIDYLPRNVHVYLATRSEPPIRIAHLRARREMIEIGPGEIFPIFE